MSAVLRGVLAAADRVWPKILQPRLDADGLMAASRVAVTAPARDGLRNLMAALAKDSELSLFGRLAVRWDMLRLLRNAALVARAHQRRAELSAAPVVAPIFILGLPRSGTTFLHTLLAADEDNLVPRHWQTIYPKPRPANFDAAHDKNAQAVGRQLKLLAGLAPGFAALHPVHADSPQECSEITAHVFESFRFDTTFRVPDYLAWLDANGDLAGFEFHKRFLQFLQDGTARRWVLKCPDHTFSLETILRVYPDARFVIVHRDPVQVFGSVAVLTEVLRRPFLRRVDAAEIGAQVSERWLQGTRRLMAFDARTDIAPERKVHLRHEALIAAPVKAVEMIYQRFEMRFSDRAREAMAGLVAARPSGGYVRHAPYVVQRFAVSPERLRERFAGYVAAYCSEQHGLHED